MVCKRVLIILLCLSFLAACAPPGPFVPATDSARPWKHADLRLLDGLDGPQAGQDIVAVYTRQTGADLEIRVDLLQSASVGEFDLYLAVDSRPGGQPEMPIGGQAGIDWETWIGFPSGLPSNAITAGGERLTALTPRLFRDLELDAAVVRLAWRDLGSVPARLRFQVFLCDPGTTRVVESSEPFAFDGQPPAPAPLLLAFWNTLPALTPAQTLRRWNGAHTGPAGHRHGLAQIIQAVEATRVPAVLLDLKTPDSLAGLEQVNGLEQVRRLAAQGLLTLPDAAFGDPLAAGRALALSRNAGLRVGIAASPLAYTPFSLISGNHYRLLFRDSPAVTGLVHSIGMRMVALPPEDAGQPGADGLSLDMRQRLLNAALATDPSLTVLGGDVQHTLWADAEVAGRSLAYIADHPWIRAVRGSELLTLPVKEVSELPVTQECQQWPCALGASSAEAEAFRAHLRQSIAALPAGSWRDQTWLMYLRLTQPSADIQRARLQDGYLGQVGYLLAAADWLAQPREASGCDRDVDWDGQAECVLSNPSLFTILKADGARLALAVHRAGSEPREWIGPSTQFALGLGPADAWQPQRGAAADPQAIPGGFADLPDPFLPYQPVSAGQEVLFNGPGGLQKIYRLAGDRIEVAYRGNPALITRIAVLLARPGWSVQSNPRAVGTGYHWRPAQQTGVSLLTSVDLQVRGALDSRSAMRQPEDPDAEYPPGHFLPYPVSEVTLTAPGPFTVTIGVE